MHALYQITCFLLLAFGLRLFPFIRMNADFYLNISFILGKIMYSFSTDQVSRGPSPRQGLNSQFCAKW